MVGEYKPKSNLRNHLKSALSNTKHVLVPATFEDAGTFFERYRLQAPRYDRSLKPHLGAFVIVQARMGSTRLRGKALYSLQNKPLLEYLLEKLKTIRNVEGVILATTHLPEDDVLEGIAARLSIPTIRGDVDNVLSRFHEAIVHFSMKTVIRLTADCPLHDPCLIEQPLELYYEKGIDFLSNTIERTYPRGFDIEIASAELLSKLHKESNTTDQEREHVTLGIAKLACKRGCFFQDERDDSLWRLTVDEMADYLLVQRVVEEFTDRNLPYSLGTLQSILDKHPEWRSINQHVEQKQPRK